MSLFLDGLGEVLLFAFAFAFCVSVRYPCVLVFPVWCVGCGWDGVPEDAREGEQGVVLRVCAWRG